MNDAIQDCVNAKLEYDTQMPFSRPSILRIHCWGGLGSQLYAWALLEDLLVDFPNRRIKLVLHSSGVTRRESDLDFLRVELEVDVVDDFKKTASNLRGSSEIIPRWKIGVSGCLKFILQKSGFLATANDDYEYAKIRSWTIDIRGHYSKRTISNETLSQMKTRAERCGKSWFTGCLSESINLDVFRIHVRLGDLLTLGTKEPLAFERIYSAISQYDTIDSGSRTFYVASDSLEIACTNFLEKFPQDLLIPVVGDPWSTISVLSRSGIFIGTNSKISVWVAILRFNQDRTSKVSLPEGAMNHLKHNLNGFSDSTSLRLY